MELPFTVVFEPPSHRALRAQLRMRGYWVAGSIVALAIGTACVIANLAHADALAARSSVPLRLDSVPAHANVSLDGHARGSTPLEVWAAPGSHSVRMSAPSMQESEYQVEVGNAGVSFEAHLWRDQPEVTRLRPVLPGAHILGVQMLADGRHVAMAIGIEPGPQLQAWRLEPQTGSTELVLADAAGKRLSFAPDGGLLAYLGYEIGPPRARGADVSAAPRRKSSVVWLADARHTEPWASPWRAPLDADEELVDLSWSPMADRLLIVSRGETAPDVVRSRGWLLEPSTGQADQVFTLPSEVVPGTVGWSPNGQALAFVAHAGQVNALCVLRLPGGFRYLADLETTPKPPLGMAPVEWSPDGGRIAFVAPPQRPPDAVGWPQAEPVHLTYVAGADDLVPVAAGDAGLDTVAWREDGQIVGLGREGGDGRLALKLVSAAADQSSTQVLARLPLHPSDRYAAGWALEQGRLVLVTQSAISEELEYWLISLATEVVR